MDLHLATLPASVYVAKSLTERNRLNFQQVARAGHRLVAWDEEGLVWASREVYWATKLDQRALALPELLLAWGEANARAWRDFPGYGGNPIAVTGNPRADLLRPALAPFFAAEVAAIHREVGEFILINTNFSRVNHVQPAQNRHLRWLREQRPDDPRGGFAGHKYELFQAFRDLLPRLAAALPTTTLVLRPHPSERWQTWQELAAGLANVRVCREGNVVPWLLAARALVHNGCTTALEAFVMQRPALAYMPLRSPAFDHPLPNGLSLQFEDVDSLVATLEDCIADAAAVFGRQATLERRALLGGHVAGSDDELASHRVVETLLPLLVGRGPVAGSNPLVAHISQGLRRTVRAIQGRVAGQGNHRAYLEHMFPVTTLQDTCDRVARLSACLGLREPPAVAQLRPNLFQLGPQRSA